MSQTFIYLPWVRRGLAGAIESKDLSTDVLQNRVKMNVNVTLNTGDTAQTTVRMYGPGDVVGFDARQVIRTEPGNLAQNFEPNYFPFVEFDSPDFPWLFTPATANAKGQLRPWICLVVVEKEEKNLGPGQPLPVLTVVDVEATLPDLEESWAWAYAQVLDTTNIINTLVNKPEENLSRLVCPRKLEPNKTYYACIVPAFKAGVLAGLGQAVDDNAPLEPAWTLPQPNSTNTGGAAAAPVSIQLPVYYHWEFSTGPAGDFEALVWKLERRNLDQLSGEIGNRPMSVPLVTGDLGLEGALRVAPPSQEDEDAVKVGMKTFTQEIEKVINAPDTVASLFGSLTLKPPLYGQWHAASRTLIPNNPKQCPKWLYELNTDPRQRAVAALGTRIIQEKQEQLMTAAWDQVEEIETANQFLRQAQLARSTDKGLYQQINNLPTSTLIDVTAPVHARVSASTQTVYAALENSPIPKQTFSGQFRRVSAGRGIVSRRAQDRQGNGLHTGRLIERLNQRQIEAASLSFTLGDMTTQSVQTYDNLQGSTPEDLSFIDAAMRQQAGMNRHRETEGNYEPANLERIRQYILKGLDPEITIAERWKKRIHPRPEGWYPEDTLEPIMAAPEFPIPMYKPLAEISHDLLLPGVGKIPSNVITSLATNPRFIRAFMVGLNHEMSRELLWREFPTDQRGTYFRQFWDPTGAVPRAQTDADKEKRKDILPIHQWDKTQGLNDELNSVVMNSKIVLLIRGELLGRYPGAIIYMAKAAWNNEPNVDGRLGRYILPIINDTANPGYIAPGDEQYPEKYPEFIGSISPDITFMCFSVDPEEARGDESGPRTPETAGWFFVIQQPPTDPRYGLDETLPSNTVSTWMDLAWPHVAKTKGGYISLAGGLQQNFPNLKTPSQADWGRDVTSADLATICLQRPLRLAIHASDLLP